MVLGELRKGVKISFIIDIRFIELILDFIKDSDLFICEVMYGDDLDILKVVRNKYMIFREVVNFVKFGNVK